VIERVKGRADRVLAHSDAKYFNEQMTLCKVSLSTEEINDFN